MNRQNHQGTGSNIGRDQINAERQANMGDGSIYNENVTHIHYAGTAIPRHLTTTPFIPDVFQGREDDLLAIRAKLTASNQPLLLVNGQGGIGKTSLAAKYWQTYQDHYAHTAWLYAPSRLDDALLMLALPLQVNFPDTMPTAQRLEVLQAAVANLTAPCLLIIDNANNAEELGRHWGFLHACNNCHILLTSRLNGFNGAGYYPIKALPEAVALSVFNSHYPEYRTADDGLFASIYQAVGGNTLVLELLAKNLEVLNHDEMTYSLSDLLKDLQQRGLLRLAKNQPVRMAGKGQLPSLQTATPTAIIAALYDELEQITPLSTAEQWALCNLAVLPAENLPFPWLKDLLVFDLSLTPRKNIWHRVTAWLKPRPPAAAPTLSQILSGLAARGWLENSVQDGVSHYKTSPVVQEITRHKNAGHLQGYCAGLVVKLTKKLACEANTGHLLNVSYADAAAYCRYAEIVTTWLMVGHKLGLLYGHIGRYHLTTGNLNKALRAFTEFHAAMTTLHQRESDNPSVKNNLATACQYLGVAHTTLGNLEQAFRWLQESHSLNQKLHTTAPDRLNFKNSLAISCQHLGSTHTTLGDLQQALRWYEDGHRLAQELHAADPDHFGFKDGLAIASQHLGNTHTKLGDLQQALRWYQDYQRQKQELHAATPSHLGFKNGLAIACQNLGNTHTKLGDLQQALRWYQDYHNLAQELHTAAPNHLGFKNALAVACQKLGNTHTQLSDLQQALCWYQENHRLAQELHAAAFDHLSFKNNVAIACQCLGNTHTKLGDVEHALYYYQDYYRLKQEIHITAPDHPSFTNGLAIALIKLGKHYEQEGDVPLALDHYRQAQVLCAELVAKSPPSVEFKNNLTWVNRRLEKLKSYFIKT
ncbi:tetratricopeptide repeat protein [Methylovulum psychrotolerans]|uniref:tetratricopeptide repeat protein n=1 Tax=Methylovulum psychrotolerans TaxID=1704499 RepID=UPI001BFF63AB|nr:tetratricopeptide repeat protein [Methylovulum psychrotolerans]MBT9099443.1 tetratricopeptide repeat protein [Methylovulum psychrotolerans]